MTGLLRFWAPAAVVALTAVAGPVWGDATRDASFEDQDGTNGTFEVNVWGHEQGPHRVKAEFKQAFWSFGTLELHDWHVSMQFFDREGKRYKQVDQPNQKGPSSSGSFEFPSGREPFRPKVGKLKVSLFEKRGREWNRLALVEFDIGIQENDAVEFLPKIEKIMLKRGWKRGAALQHRWFSEKENQLVGKSSDGKGTKGKLSIDNKTITMDWVLSFPRAREKYDELVKSVANDAAKKELKKLLQEKFKKTKEKTISFGDFSEPGNLYPQHTNSRELEYRLSTAITGQVDDLDAALGAFSLFIIPKGKATETPKGIAVTISEVGVFVFDSFDFNGEQVLGWWAEPDQFSPTQPNAGGHPNPPGAGFGYTQATNKLYREYRQRHRRGGDFLVISDVKVTKVKHSFTLK